MGILICGKFEKTSGKLKKRNRRTQKNARKNEEE